MIFIKNNGDFGFKSRFYPKLNFENQIKIVKEKKKNSIQVLILTVLLSIFKEFLDRNWEFEM